MIDDFVGCIAAFVLAVFLVVWNFQKINGFIGSQSQRFRASPDDELRARKKSKIARVFPETKF